MKEKKMTWGDYLEYLIEVKKCNVDNAYNVVGHLMDLYEDYEWEHELPFKDLDF